MSFDEKLWGGGEEDTSPILIGKQNGQAERRTIQEAKRKRAFGQDSSR